MVALLLLANLHVTLAHTEEQSQLCTIECLNGTARTTGLEVDGNDDAMLSMVLRVHADWAADAPAPAAAGAMPALADGSNLCKSTVRLSDALGWPAHACHVHVARDRPLHTTCTTPLLFYGSRLTPPSLHLDTA